MSKIILFEPRSGSTYLAKYLSYGYKYKDLGEFLNGKHGIRGGEHFKENRLEYLNRLRGMKDYILNLAPTDYIKLGKDSEEFFKGKSCILIKRKNKRLQILSFLYMSVTRCFHYYHNSKIETSIVTAKEEHFKNLLKELDNIDNVASKFVIDKEIIYEDFESDKQYLVDQFGIEISDVSLSLPIKPYIDIEKCFENINQINEWIKDSAYKD